MRQGTLLLMVAATLAAQSRWIETHGPQFQVASEAPAKSARRTLAQLEQFRFALGAVTGSELKLSSPLLVLVFRNPAALEAAGATPALVDGRAQPMLALSADQAIPAAVLRELARRLLAANTGRLPEAYEKGLVTFISTLRVDGAKVIWGDTPPTAERSRDWARVHLLATTPEYAGRMRVLFFNLLRGVPPEAAWSNAYSRSAAEMEREVDQYWKAGRFAPADGPSAAINPERDFYFKDMAAGDVTLALADLLNTHSPGLYQQMLTAHQHAAEAHEGLGLLALRAGDAAGARESLKQALAAGSRNAGALVEYARLEKNPAPAREALDEALKLNPQLAEAHFLLGQKASDPERLTVELQAAARLGPQEARYWEALARWQLEQKSFQDAAKSWTRAEQAATNSDERERLHQARMAIEEQRLDYEEAERARVAAEKQRALDRLKAQALNDLRAAEGKSRAAPDAVKNAIPWWEDAPGAAGKATRAEGTLLRVDCGGKTRQVVVETSDGKTLRLRLTDRRLFEAGALSCGPGKKQRVAVDFKGKADPRAGSDGELSSITFH